MADGYTIPSIYMFSKFDLSILVGVIRNDIFYLDRDTIYFIYLSKAKKKTYDEAVCILSLIFLGTNNFLHSH